MKNYLALGALLVLLLSACSTSVGAAAAPTLAGTSWAVTQIKDAQTLADHQPTMAFQTDRVSGLASCNGYSAGFNQTSTGISITPGPVTAMACSPETVMTQETAFLAALSAANTARSAGDGVEILDANKTVVLTLAKIVDTPLEGTTWTLTGIRTAQAVTSPVADSDVTVSFANGSLSGKACNRFTGTATAANGTLTIGALASTKMACASEELSKQETKVLAILQSATGYAISGTTLTITAASEQGLTFTAP